MQGDLILNQSDIIDEFNVLHDQYHAGTFNGCLETLHQSLEHFIKSKVQQCIPGVVLDYRTMLSKCFRFLAGEREKFFVNAGLAETYQFYQRASIFTQQAYDFLYETIQQRNDHTHQTSMYPVLRAFQNLLIPLGPSHVLVFNPNNVQNQIFLVRVKLVADVTDMEICDASQADLIFECLTKKEFQNDRPENANLDLGPATHAIVVYYGKDYFFAFIRKPTYNSLRGYFSYESRAKWKTHYFRFSTGPLMRRLLP